MKHAFAAVCLLVACSSPGAPSEESPSGGASSAGAATAGTTSGAGTAGGKETASSGASGAAGATAGGSSGSAGAGSAGASGSAGTSASAGASGSEASGSAGMSSSAGSSGSAGAASLPAVSVYIAGDSTVSEYKLDPNNPKSWAGWGQMLRPHFTSKVTVVDAAVGGRTARRFIQEKLLDGILGKLKKGDYLLVQFGTNDSNPSATYTLDGTTYPYFAAADSDFKVYLQQYIDGARGKQAIPVLVTPPPRNSAYCKGGRSLANYGKAMLDLGQERAVAVVDLGFATHAHLSAICPKPTTGAQETFFKVNADGTIDGTHFQENGARVMAGFVADGIGNAMLGLAAYRAP